MWCLHWDFIFHVPQCSSIEMKVFHIECSDFFFWYSDTSIAFTCKWLLPGRDSVLFFREIKIGSKHGHCEVWMRKDQSSITKHKISNHLKCIILDCNFHLTLHSGFLHRQLSNDIKSEGHMNMNLEMLISTYKLKRIAHTWPCGLQVQCSCEQYQYSWI